MFDDLRDLYQEVIFDHNRNPRNFREIEDADRRIDGFNPLCGDRMTLFLKLDGNIVSDASFQGQGCAISTASASLMTEMLIGL
ncbi:MAG TPA: SUF system NifU family Fe-S cluster assembly protein, partial [Xanthomonadales bacterium]|nr:SUF system NifU family Fe-S cluster assembly protein [Xanthomonadales bacterium]